MTKYIVDSATVDRDDVDILLDICAIFEKLELIADCLIFLEQGQYTFKIYHKKVFD